MAEYACAKCGFSANPRRYTGSKNPSRAAQIAVIYHDCKRQKSQPRFSIEEKWILSLAFAIFCIALFLAEHPIY